MTSPWRFWNKSLGSQSLSEQKFTVPPRRIPSDLEHVLYKEVRWSDEYGMASIERIAATIDDAEVVSSQVLGYVKGYGTPVERHAPVLDIDLPAQLVPSGTPGHHHLYIDHDMSWRQYKRLLKALAKAGIVEKSYVKASIRRGHTAVRVPWKPKVVS